MIHIRYPQRRSLEERGYVVATFDSGRQRYSMNFYASHQRPLQRRSYTGRPSRPAEGQLRVNVVDSNTRWLGPLYPPERPLRLRAALRERAGNGPLPPILFASEQTVLPRSEPDEAADRNLGITWA